MIEMDSNPEDKYNWAMRFFNIYKKDNFKKALNILLENNKIKKNNK
jgi:predicted RNA-binding protein (virulence factor B family)